MLHQWPIWRPSPRAQRVGGFTAQYVREVFRIATLLALVHIVFDAINPPAVATTPRVRLLIILFTALLLGLLHVVATVLATRAGQDPPRS
jgi:hypothetical protein